MATQRSERIRCHLPCEIHLRRRRKISATVTGLSEKGLRLETDQGIDQGNAFRICILPHRGDRAVRADAIAWSTHERRTPGAGRNRFVVGFLVSDPSSAFLALIEEVRRREDPAAGAVDVRKTTPCDGALPRPRSPLPPPKEEEEETLPRFRVRLKHGGSPRSRSATLRARSAREAERRALGDLEPEWEVLEVVRLREP